MANHNIIVVGASAGGVSPLTKLINALPASLDASIFIVMHVQSSSSLDAVLATRSVLPVVNARDNEKIERGHVYVAPPNHHMLLEKNRIHLTNGPTVNYVRPAIDPLFHSAAIAYGPRTVGVLLSGTLDDGSGGMAAIKSRGGITIVQDPAEAQHPDMPLNAIELVTVDHILPVVKIAKLLVELATKPASTGKKFPLTKAIKAEAIGGQIAAINTQALNQIGTASTFTCPECHGTLWQIDDQRLHRYRCRTGHAYGLKSLLAAQTDSLENTLWAAVRALEENSALAYRVANRNESKHPRTTKLFKERAKVAEKHAEQLREILLRTNAKN
jgi:two-component system chemotaxis response regulator CheB